MSMNKIKILHFYPYLANLYGDSGNVKILVDYFKDQELEVEVKPLKLGDEWADEDFDFYYMGSSTEGNLKLVFEHFSSFKDRIWNLIEQDKHFLFTGNSIEILGTNIILDGNRKEGLGFFNFNVKKFEKRWSNEAIFLDEKGRDILGYQNLANMVDKSPYPWFKVLKGLGAGEKKLAEKTSEEQATYGGKEVVEGIKYKNMRASSIIGPLVAKNYFLAEEIVEKILKEKGLEYNKKEHPFDKKAYEDFKVILHRPGRQHG